MIFELAGKHKKTGFVLSDDIWKRRVPEEFLGKTYFTGPGEELELTAPLQEDPVWRSGLLNPQMKVLRF